MRALLISSAVLCGSALSAGLFGCQGSEPETAAGGSPAATTTATATASSPAPKTPAPASTTGSTFDSGLPTTCDPGPTNQIYAFSAQDLAATETVPLCRYRNKVMLVTNVASKCGNTPQYGPLQALYEKHRDAGFFVLGFPCNQFGGQEPGDAVEITACTTKYGVSFPMFEKITVNTDSTFGPEHPLYAWLKAQPGGAGKIEWNFAKFLIGRDGKLIKRYSASFLNGAASEQAQLDADIAAALAK